MKNYNELKTAVENRDDMRMHEDSHYARGDNMVIEMSQLVLLVHNNEWDDNEDDTMTCVYMHKDVYEQMQKDMDREKSVGTAAGELPEAIFAMSYGYGYRFDDTRPNIEEKDTLEYFGRKKNNPAMRIGDPTRKIVYLIQTDDWRTTVAVFDNYHIAKTMLCNLYYGIEEWPAGACDDMRIVPIAINQFNGFIG
jgi:hypothetical protein